MIEVKEGKSYKTRDGRTVGPMRPNKNEDARYPWEGLDQADDTTEEYTRIGRYFADGIYSNLDLIEEADEISAIIARCEELEKENETLKEKILSLEVEIEHLSGAF